MPRSSNKKKSRIRPLILAIFEGWGIAPAHAGNAFTEAKPAYLTHLISHYPALALSASPLDLGLPSGTIMTSELGHAIIGAGNASYVPRYRVDDYISAHGSLHSSIFDSMIRKGRHLHLIGLLSAAEKESSLAHLDQLITAAQTKGVGAIFLHAILDGRDTSSYAAQSMITAIEEKYGSAVTIASLCGRFYALDPHASEERINKASASIVNGLGNQAISAQEALRDQYAKKIYDEEFPPTALCNSLGEALGVVQEGDCVLFFNFNGTLIAPLARSVELAVAGRADCVSLSPIHGAHNIISLLPPLKDDRSVGEIIASAGLRQLRVSDSEGFADATVFLNGGVESAYNGEERDLIPLPPQEKYSENPAMVNDEIARSVVRAIESKQYDFIVVTFPALDRLAAEGSIEGAIEAFASLDINLKKITTAALSAGGAVLVTASNSRSENISLHDQASNLNSNSNSLPLLIISDDLAGYSLNLPQPVEGDLSTVPCSGTLFDVAPTILAFLGLSTSPLMKGKSFFSGKTV